MSSSLPFTTEPEPPRLTRAVQWVIALCVTIAFLQLTVVSAEDVRKLGFQADALPGRWWSFVTYMFAHAGFWHLALNMYTLWLFGPRVERAMGTGDFARYFLWCGLGGAIAHWIFGGGSLMVGASAAVYGVMLAYAMRWPGEEIHLFGVIPMKVKWLVALLVTVNLVSAMPMSGAEGGGIAYLAHLGGMAAGFVYLRMAGAMRFEHLRPQVSPIPDPGDEPPRAVPRGAPRQREKLSEIDEILARSKSALAKRPLPAAPPRREPVTAVARREQVDRLLDKISERGIESLSPDERRILEEWSRELRAD